jgi:phage gp36-like protein
VYCTAQKIADEFSLPRLTAALDDDGDGTADTGLLDRLITDAGDTVDGFLAGRYATPFSPVPKLVAEAAFVFVCEKIHARRRQGPDEVNPYTARANDFRKQLKQIADGDLSLDAALVPAFTPGAVIQTDSAINVSTL